MKLWKIEIHNEAYGDVSGAKLIASDTRPNPDDLGADMIGVQPDAGDKVIIEDTGLEVIPPGATLWTCQYSCDDGEEVELVYCQRKPTFDEVVAQFEHLQERVKEGWLSAEFMKIQQYSGIPAIG